MDANGEQGDPLVLDRQASWLRVAFAAGAITDALAVIPMLFPFFAKLMWGFDQPTASYTFAMGYAASLMAGWTGLLLWAYRDPIERKFVALLTIFVIAGLAATEAVLVVSGGIDLLRVTPTFVLQGILAWMFAAGYWGFGPAAPDSVEL